MRYKILHSNGLSSAFRKSAERNAEFDTKPPMITYNIPRCARHSAEVSVFLEGARGRNLQALKMAQ